VSTVIWQKATSHCTTSQWENPNITGQPAGCSYWELCSGVPICYHKQALFVLKLPLSVEGFWPPSNTYESRSQIASQSVRPFLHSTQLCPTDTDRQTDRQTDYATCDIILQYPASNIVCQWCGQKTATTVEVTLM